MVNQAADITVVIPAKNEEQMIAELVAKARQHADVVLVVDGCSSDQTAAIAKESGAQVIVDSGRGKGAAIRESLLHVATRFVVFMDADGSHDPEDIPKLVQPLREDSADHVSGSRLIGGSSELHGGFDECFRLMGSSFITALINWRFGVRLSESQNGFRAAKSDVLRALPLRASSTTIEQEMIMRTLHAGYRMGEVPTHEHKRRFGESHIKLHRVWYKYLWSVLRNLFI